MQSLQEGILILKKEIAMALSMCLLVESVPLACYAENATTSTNSISSDKDIEDNDILDIASITAASPKTVNDVLAQRKFSSSKGHGFAAERGNDLADKIRGKNTRVVGDNNIKNGPDRLIVNRDGTPTFIQDKYYGDITQGINACFDGETGMFRYVDGDGNPMLIEVPSDQYADAIDLMKTKISEGKIPGVTDSEEANTLVKKGALSYKQAVNLSKAGTLQSLKYDAINGTVTATSAFGISTLLNYIARSEAEVQSLEQQKKASMQKIFSQEVRFKCEDGTEYPDWEEKKIGELTSQLITRNKENTSYPVYSVNNIKGFIPQLDQFKDREVASSDKTNYKIVEYHHFAYNPSRINVGSIAYLNERKTVIVSPLYVVFECTGIIPEYLNLYVRTKDFHNQRKTNTVGSVRDSLTYEGFSEITMFVPCLEEQQKISDFLSTYDEAISYAKQELEKWKELKRGLLQQMFI